MTQVHRAAAILVDTLSESVLPFALPAAALVPSTLFPDTHVHLFPTGGSRLYIVSYRLGNWGKAWGWGLRFACRREVSACQCPSRPLGRRCCLHGWPHIRVLVPAASANCPAGPRVGCPPSTAFLSNTAVLEGGGAAQEQESRGCHRAEHSQQGLQGAQGRSALRGAPWGLGSVWLHQSPRGCWLLRDTHCVPMRCHSPGDTLGSAHSY